MIEPIRLERVVKAYDVRGVVGDELDDDLARALGAAAADVLAGDGGVMVVGRDMRVSSPGLANAFVDGVLARGVDVVDIGLASTDQLYFASGVLDAAGAMITASHNPAQYNGIKLCRAGAGPVSIDSGLGRIRDIASGGVLPAPERGLLRTLDITDRYARHVRAFVDADRLRSMRVAVDAGNGMAGLVWPLVVAELGITTTELCFELDGTFPNHPANPLDEANLADLRSAVEQGGHALGLAFDGDADRVFVVDERGMPVSASIVGAIVAERMLERHPGATVLYSLVCSRVVPETIERAGGVPVRTRVGHSFVKQRMAETDAVFAVEHSGHYYFRDNYRADSGMIAALLVMEALAVAGGQASTLVDAYDRYHRSGELNIEVADPAHVVEQVAASFAGRGTIDREDGVTVRLLDGWFNLRPSNTEARLRLNVEADDARTLGAMIDEVTAQIDAAG